MKDESISSLTDQVIDILKSSGCIEINDLAVCLGVDVTEIDRVVGVLEREDLARIEYQFTKTYVLWAGEGSENIPMPPVENQAIELDRKSDKKPTEKKAHKDMPLKLNGKLISNVNPNFKNGKNAKETGRAEKEGKPEIKEIVKERTDIIKPRPQDKAMQTTPSQKIAPIAAALDINAGTQDEFSTSQYTDGISAMSLELRRSIDGIKVKKKELAELQMQETKFMEEKYVPLNKKIEMEIGTITEMIIEKEKEIDQQKAKAKMLVERVGDIEVDTLRIRDTELRAREEFENALESLEMILDKIRETRRGLGYEVKVSKKILSDQANDIANIGTSITSLSDNENEIERGVALARAKIEEEKKGLDSMMTALNESKKTRETIKNRISEISSAFDSESLKEIDKNINNLARLEVRLEACREEYSNALDSLKKKSRENAESIERLRETIQFNLVRKMANELDRVGEDYENKMSEAFEEEKNLKRRIENVKENLSAHINYAKKLSRKLSEIVPKGRDITDANMMQELKEIERTVPEAEKAGSHGNNEVAKKEIKLIKDAREAFSNFKKGVQDNLDKGIKRIAKVGKESKENGDIK